MATYYIDDGGDNTDGSTWAKAYTSMKSLDTAVAIAAGDIIYVGHDHVCQATHSTTLDIQGPTVATNAPAIFISVTQGSSPPTYQASTTAQIDTTEGAYDIRFRGNWALYGVSLKSGAAIRLAATDTSRALYFENIRCAPAANSFVGIPATGGALVFGKNLVVDLTADGTTTRTAAPIQDGSAYEITNIVGLSFVNAGYRTGTVIQNGGREQAYISGADFSGFNNGTLCELMLAGSVGVLSVISNCITASTWAPLSGSVATGSNHWFHNCGPSNAPTYIYHAAYNGATLSSSSIYRTGGAQVESTTTAWLITTSGAPTAEGYEYQTPWIYGSIASTGSKNFDVYITNDTANFNDSQVWLDVEYLGTSSSGQTAIGTNHRTITTTAAAHTTDSSTWNGSGPSFTYKQRLRVTATVNQTGMFRARVVIGLASIASSRYFYVDPLVTVS